VPRPVVVLPRAPAVNNKTVAAGTSVVLMNAIEVNPDCSLIGLPVLRVVQAPTHGTVSISEQYGFPSYPRDNVRSACNTVRVPSNVAQYTPTPGFVGSDFVAMESISAMGSDMQAKFAITVK